MCLGFTVLRLFRAFRVFRLFKRVSSLKKIIEGNFYIKIDYGQSKKQNLGGIF